MSSPTRLLGRYEVLKTIGTGGMAVVHLARQAGLDRYVALKEMRALHPSEPEMVKRFLQESRIGGSLSHPNIVTVFDFFEVDGTPFIAMEYLERGSLRPHIGTLGLEQCAGVLRDVLAGLAHAEAAGVVHRDLKPENLLVTGDGQVKIADFGIAKARISIATDAPVTAAGQALGTPWYMAPEQAMGSRDIGPWTDLYAVGCIAYELVTGHQPFHETDGAMAVMLRHVTEPVPPARSMTPSLPSDFSDWIGELLAKDPDARPRGARAAWTALEEILIDDLGARWHREAVLGGREVPPDAPGPTRPYTPPPPDLRPVDVIEAWPEIDPERRRPPAADDPDRTVPPLHSPTAAAELPAARPRPRRLLLAAAMAVALVAVAATATVLRSDDPGGAAAERSQPSAAATASATATATPSPPVDIQRVQAVLSDLNRAVKVDRSNLRAARSARRQAISATAIQGDFRDAARRLARLPADRQVARLESTLRATAGAYAALAAAGRAADRRRWSARARDTRRREEAVRGAVRALPPGEDGDRVRLAAGVIPALVVPKPDRPDTSDTSPAPSTGGGTQPAPSSPAPSPATPAPTAAPQGDHVGGTT